jgi:opacity protein-like surface antigen
MKKLLAMAVAAGALAVAAPASAQIWQSINQRQAQLDARIDAGVRDGSLTREEAFRLRREFNDLTRLEARYREDGLSFGERADLDRRFDALSQQIRFQRNDDQQRGGYDRGGYGRDDYDRGYGRGGYNHDEWTPISYRDRQIQMRINVGLRNRTISPQEADRLREQFHDLLRVEAQYMRNGLNGYERRDLDRRYDRLNYRITAEIRDRNYWYG